jgi:hypothetical protein
MNGFKRNIHFEIEERDCILLVSFLDDSVFVDSFDEVIIFFLKSKLSAKLYIV